MNNTSPMHMADCHYVNPTLHFVYTCASKFQNKMAVYVAKLL